MYYPTLRYYHAITIDHTKVPGDTTDQTVILTANSLNDDIKTSGGALAARSDGGDIRLFSDAALDTPLPFDLITFVQNATPANATVEIAVKVSLSSSTDKTIYIGWGDPNLTGLTRTDTYGQDNAYKSGWKQWCPMKDVTTSTVKDRTVNDRTGTKNGANNPTEGTTSTLCNQYQTFVNANSSYIDFPSLSTGTQFTVIFPFKFLGTGTSHGYQRLMSNKSTWNAATGFEISLYVDSATQLQITGSNGVQWNPTIFGNLNDHAWENLAVKFNGAAVDVFLYTTKTSNASAINSVANNSNVVCVGDNAGHNEATLEGNVDMASIYVGALSDAEIQATQNNITSRSTFTPTIGSTLSVPMSSRATGRGIMMGIGRGIM